MTSRSDQEQSRNDKTQLIITSKIYIYIYIAILPQMMRTDVSVVWGDRRTGGGGKC